VRASRTITASLLVAAALVGCGSSSDGDRAGLTSRQAQALVSQLEAARSAAAARDVPATQAAIDRFRQSVARLRRARALSDATARSLRTGAARVLQRVQSDDAPAPAPATESTPAPAPLPPGHKRKHEDKKKHDEGKGHKEKGD
jgi:hypothetical protein